MKFFWGLLCGALLTVALWAGALVFYAPDAVKVLIDKNPEYDVFFIAAQLGRLDLISVVLALIAAIFLFAAFPFTKMVELKCQESVTERYTKFEDDTREKLSGELIQILQGELPNLTRSYVSMRTAASDTSGADLADSIAGSQEGE